MTAEQKLAQDRKQDRMIAETFPASDPPATTGAAGPRAVPPEAMMPEPPPGAGDTVQLRRRFAHAEEAKLMLEALVREGPMDRMAAALRPAGAGVELSIDAPRDSADRLRMLLHAV